MANAPGFISTNNIYADGSNTGNVAGRTGANLVLNTQTEVPVGAAVLNTAGYYTKLEQMGSYTGILVKQCPEFARLFMPQGGWDEKVSCRIGAPGQCETDAPDFCIDGEDFKCPAGTVAQSTSAIPGSVLRTVALVPLALSVELLLPPRVP